LSTFFITAVRLPGRREEGVSKGLFSVWQGGEFFFLDEKEPKNQGCACFAHSA
jgi:hypothetical protein